MSEQAPLPFTSQWPEGRSFPRTYYNNPDYQARFAMGLISFRESLILEVAGDESSDKVIAIDLLLLEFSERYPEYLEVPEADERLVSYVSEIRAAHE